jgi:hypothetical protein
MYLSDIQKGIQTAHLLNEFWKKYAYTETLGSEMLTNWSCLGSTIIMLNGGNCVNLNRISDLFRDVRNNYPWAYFEEEALYYSPTAVGIILPENFSTAEDRTARIAMKCYNYPNLLMYAKLAELLNNSSLA